MFLLRNQAQQHLMELIRLAADRRRLGDLATYNRLMKAVEGLRDWLTMPATEVRS
jgi:hypothetical protein